MLINEQLASTVEAKFRRFLPSILEQMNFKLKPVGIGGKFNEDGIMLEISLVPIDMDPAESMRFVLNQQNEGHEIEYIEPQNSYRNLSRLTGLSAEKIKRLEGAAVKLNLKTRTGDLFKKGENKYVCVGYSPKRESYVFASIISGECKYLKADRVTNFKRLKERFDLT